jgi:sensor histidine kinase regulating citrate/malate metabolism
MKAMSSCVIVGQAGCSLRTSAAIRDKDGTMQHTTADYTVTRLRSWPAMASGPTALVVVLAIVIVALAAGLAAVILIGPNAGAMP